MEFHRPGVQDEVQDLCIILFLFLGLVRCMIGTIRIVDHDPGLHVVAVDIELDAPSVIFHAPGLHLHTVSEQVVVGVFRCHSIQHMIAGLPDVVQDFHFKGQHPFCVHVPGAGDEVLRVRILPRQAPGQQVTAIVQLAAFDEVIAFLVPAGWVDHGNVLAVVIRQKLRTEDRISLYRAAEFVQPLKFLVGGGAQIHVGEGRDALIDFHIRRTEICRYVLCTRIGSRLRHSVLTACKQDHQTKKKPLQHSFHFLSPKENVHAETTASQDEITRIFPEDYPEFTRSH